MDFAAAKFSLDQSAGEDLGRAVLGGHHWLDPGLRQSGGDAMSHPARDHRAASFKRADDRGMMQAMAMVMLRDPSMLVR